LLLLITFPIVALSALAIKIDSPGPVFFKQDRVGKGGNIFTTWKLRSMRHNAEENGAVWAKKKDKLREVLDFVCFIKAKDVIDPAQAYFWTRKWQRMEK